MRWNVVACPLRATPIRLPILLAHDGNSAADRLGNLGEGQILLADRGYDSGALRPRLGAQGALGNIKPMPGRVNLPSVPGRALFQQAQQLRAVTTRFKKHDAD